MDSTPYHYYDSSIKIAQHSQLHRTRINRNNAYTAIKHSKLSKNTEGYAGIQPSTNSRIRGCTNTCQSL